MLSNKQYYHRTVRKLVIIFGNMFNNLKMVKYNNAGTVEIERIVVPLAYASKERFYKRITQDINLTKEIQISLPRMAFEMTSLSYDPLRKNSTQIDNFMTSPTVNKAKNVKLTPYNFDFNLHIFVRNTEDGMQIVEQILPYFNPDYTVTADFLGNGQMKLDIPIVFNSINYDDSYEGDQSTTRVLVWTLNFTVKGYLFGPVSDISIIKKVTANVFDDTRGAGIPVAEIAFANTGNNIYKIDELVYQGDALEMADATGYVGKYSTETNTLIVYDTTGYFVANSNVIGVVSGTNYRANTVENKTVKIATITVQPSPNTANASDAYGFSTTITEYV